MYTSHFHIFIPSIPSHNVLQLRTLHHSCHYHSLIFIAQTKSNNYLKQKQNKHEKCSVFCSGCWLRCYDIYTVLYIFLLVFMTPRVTSCVTMIFIIKDCVVVFDSADLILFFSFQIFYSTPLLYIHIYHHLIIIFARHYYSTLL